jgi:hypothetical protein
LGWCGIRGARVDMVAIASSRDIMIVLPLIRSDH